MMPMKAKMQCLLVVFLFVLSNTDFFFLFFQDYGPRPNFKKKRVKIGEFSGLPPFSREFVARMKAFDCLADYEPVEQCHLDYSPERGSAIDAHRDDEWLWGESLVTINLLSDTYLTFVSGESGVYVAILVPMPRRSLIIVCGEARHVWLHAVRRCDIKSRRIAITYRDLGPDFMHGGPHEAVGNSLREIAKTFGGKPVWGPKRLALLFCFINYFLINHIAWVLGL